MNFFFLFSMYSSKSKGLMIMVSKQSLFIITTKDNTLIHSSLSFFSRVKKVYVRYYNWMMKHCVNSVNGLPSATFARVFLLILL